jgi:hypothetical protein
MWEHMETVYRALFGSEQVTVIKLMWKIRKPLVSPAQVLTRDDPNK